MKAEPLPAGDRLARLHSEFDQSPWLDNLRRRWITDGDLRRWVDRGIRGLTSNPSIFQKAISQSSDYDEQFADLVRSGTATESAYWHLVTDDIGGALDALAPVHDSSDGADGFVSVEVDPGLARDTDATLAAARRLSESIDRPNLMVKIPGTEEGLPAVRAMIGEGRSVNVTLIFSVERYRQVAEAYLAGLEDLLADRAGLEDLLADRSGAAGPAPADAVLGTVSSVASFFVSRIDTEVDRRLDAVVESSGTTAGTTAGTAAAALRGRAAVANGRAAYAAWGELFSGPRWERLAAHGARPQRPLWASTSTKNPAYPDTLYVDQLIGPGTVNTMPDDTLAAFADHGTLERTLDADPAGAFDVLRRLGDVGVDMAEVADVLEAQGVSSFVKSYEELLESLRTKAAELA